MSSWPQAVWIVKKIQKNFDFTQAINDYENKLYNLDRKVDGLIDRVSTDENLYSDRVTTFVSTESTVNRGIPANPPSNLGKGAIWLVSR